jgi:diguanylate cyclase (GGDEF)-like protein
MATPEEAAKGTIEPIAMEVENLKPIERFGWGVRARLSAIVIAAVLLFSGATGQFLVEVQRRAMFEEARQRAAALLETLSVPCAMAMSTDDLERLDAYLEELSEGGGKRLDLLGVVMLDPEGRVTALSGHGTLELSKGAPVSRARGSAASEFMDQASASDSPLWVRDQTDTGSTLLTVSMPSISGLRWGTLVASFDLSRMDRRLKAIKQMILLGTAIFALAMMWMLYVVIASIILRPIRSLSEATGKILAGDLGARVELNTGDEFGQLARTFNAMAGELQQYTTNLERRVVDRTAEVEAKNDLLEIMNTRLNDAVEELDRLARTDPLTGLFNRRAFSERLDFELRRSARTEYPIGFVLIDIDNFKAINDKHGHPTGDSVLKRVADVLVENLRTTDIICRFGGEEFAVLLLDTGRQDSIAVASKLRESIASEAFTNEDGIVLKRLTISLGVALCPEDAQDAATLLSRTDRALYRAKADGRDQVVMWSAELDAE